MRHYTVVSVLIIELADWYLLYLCLLLYEEPADLHEQLISGLQQEDSGIVGVKVLPQLPAELGLRVECGQSLGNLP